MYELIIANKGYSSWSTRSWVLMRQLGIPFNERLLRYKPGGFKPETPAGLAENFRDAGHEQEVPGLILEEMVDVAVNINWQEQTPRYFHGVLIACQIVR